MSSPTWVRVRRYRRIFATRKSRLVRRSEYSVPGWIRLTVTLAPPVSARPSGCGPLAIYAWVATKLAASSLPGTLVQVPLTWIPTLGIVYVASPLKSVRYGSTTRHHGLTGEPPAIETLTPLGPVPCSGTFAFRSQLSESRRPLLVPPCSVSPLRSRATRLTSTPCQFSV